jgi:hypothetical protein
MLLLLCKKCGAKTFTMDGRNPDMLLKCECCPQDHDHGRAANETGVACRPIEISVCPGTAQLKVTQP